MHEIIALVTTVALVVGPKNKMLKEKRLRYPGAELAGFALRAVLVSYHLLKPFWLIILHSVQFRSQRLQKPVYN